MNNGQGRVTENTTMNLVLPLDNVKYRTFIFVLQFFIPGIGDYPDFTEH